MSETTSTPTAPATCARCGRVLTDPRSIGQGLGPVCFRKVRDHALVALAAHTTAAVRKALELIADGGILPVGNGRFLAVSSDGSTRYETTASGCACPAGSFGRSCYHRAAVDLLAA